MTVASPPHSAVHVTGLSSAELSGLRARPPEDDAWKTLLMVRVAGVPPDVPPVSGRYSVTQDSLEFTPLFTFNPGRTYEATFRRWSSTG